MGTGQGPWEWKGVWQNSRARDGPWGQTAYEHRDVLSRLGIPCQGLIFWQSPRSAFWPPAPKSHQCSPACCCPPILLVYPDSGCPHAQLPPSCLLVSTRSLVPTSPWHLLDCAHRPSGHQPSRHILQPLRPLPAVPPPGTHHPQRVPNCPQHIPTRCPPARWLPGAATTRGVRDCVRGCTRPSLISMVK